MQQDGTPDLTEADALILRNAALPRAPLAMPKQMLEHAPGLWLRLLRRMPAGNAARTGG
ncbi:MAG TPA: hypothetical protein VGA75_12365 [Paracoccaceae bacterium]